MDMISLSIILFAIGCLAVVTGIFLGARTIRENQREISENLHLDEELLIHELEFFARLFEVPEEYTQYLLPELGSHLLVPLKVKIVGDLKIDISSRTFRVQVGNHAESMFGNPYDAADFVCGVLNDQIAFHITPQGTTHFQLNEIGSPEEIDNDYFVWSGALLPKMLFSRGRM